MGVGSLSFKFGWTGYFEMSDTCYTKNGLEPYFSIIAKSFDNFGFWILDFRLERK